MLPNTELPILSKIRKLLNLAKSGNEHEAASAATRAAELMSEYGLAEAELRVTDQTKPAEPIIKGDATATLDDKRAVAWKGSLAHGLAAAHGCKFWWRRGEGGTTSVLVFLGRLSSVQAADYTLSWLVKEVDRLAELAFWNTGANEHSAARTWKHSFRLGCATRIAERLVERAREHPELNFVANFSYKRPLERPQINRETPRTALVVRQRDAEEVCDEYVKVARNFRGSKSFSGASSSDGYGSGRSAGERVGLGGHKGLNAPAKRLP